MLAGRRILVTGGSSGIGRALVVAYARHGAKVWAVARRPKALAATVEPLPPESAVAVPADIATAEGREAVAASLGDERLDVVVHAAGTLGPRMELADYPTDAWDRVFLVNMTSIHLLHRRLVPHLTPSAVIIGVSSSVGRTGRGGWGMYAVSKGALETWLEVLADEWSGRVYSVNPGGTATPMRAEAMPGEDPAILPQPADVVPVFLRLAHPAAPEPTGSKLSARDWIGRDPWEDVADKPGPRSIG